MKELPEDSIVALIFIGIFMALCITGMIRSTKNGRGKGAGGTDSGTSAGGGGDGGGGDGGC